MTRRIFYRGIVLTLAVAALAGLTSARAAAPFQFAYQGKLADQNGLPKTGTYGMIFRIYDASSGGTLLATDDRSVTSKVAVSNGVFVVIVGSNPATLTGNLSTVFTGGTSRWLEVSVTGPGPGATLSPRQPLVSVPYALAVASVSVSDLAPGTFNSGTFIFPVTSTVTWGVSASRTETRDNAGLQGNAGALSGFFETVSPVNYPAGASSWWHLLDVRHDNPGNNYALQIAGGFFDQNLYFRKTNNNPAQAWSQFLSEDSNSQVTLNSFGATPTLQAAANQSLVLRQSGTGNLHFDSSGSFLFRDSDAAFATRLSINSANGDMSTSGIGTFGKLNVTGGGSFIMYNLGIGQANPQAALHVNGNIASVPAVIDSGYVWVQVPSNSSVVVHQNVTGDPGLTSFIESIEAGTEGQIIYWVAYNEPGRASAQAIFVNESTYAGVNAADRVLTPDGSASLSVSGGAVLVYTESRWHIISYAP